MLVRLLIGEVLTAFGALQRGDHVTADRNDPDNRCHSGEAFRIVSAKNKTALPSLCAQAAVPELAPEPQPSVLPGVQPEQFAPTAPGQAVIANATAPSPASALSAPGSISPAGLQAHSRAHVTAASSAGAAAEPSTAARHS